MAHRRHTQPNFTVSNDRLPYFGGLSAIAITDLGEESDRDMQEPEERPIVVSNDSSWRGTAPTDLSCGGRPAQTADAAGKDTETLLEEE